MSGFYVWLPELSIVWLSFLKNKPSPRTIPTTGIAVFWNAVPCSLIGRYQHWYAEERGRRFLVNVGLYQTTWIDIPEDCNLNFQCCENLVSCIIISIFLLNLVNKKICAGNSWTHIVCIGSIEVKKGVSPPWYNYFLCGLRGVLEVLQQVSVGMLVAVTGSVPQSSGLSSSSALVSAAALAAAHANNVCM